MIKISGIERVSREVEIEVSSQELLHQSKLHLDSNQVGELLVNKTIEFLRERDSYLREKRAEMLGMPRKEFWGIFAYQDFYSGLDGVSFVRNLTEEEKFVINKARELAEILSKEKK